MDSNCTMRMMVLELVMNATHEMEWVWKDGSCLVVDVVRQVTSFDAKGNQY